MVGAADANYGSAGPPMGLLLWVLRWLMLMDEDLPVILTRAEQARCVLSDPELAITLLLAILLLGGAAVVWLSWCGWKLWREWRDSPPF